jgi:hypothetical protein
MDESIIAATIERLTAEKRRRIDEKVAKGEAISIPWRDDQALVIGGPERVEAVVAEYKASELAKLRAAGETREIIIDEPLVIVTGVPRAGRDDDYCDDDYPARIASVSPAHPAPPEDNTSSARPEDTLSEPPEPVVRSESVRSAGESTSEPRYVRAQVRRPDPEKDDPGEIKEGQYRVEGNLLRVQDMQGRSLGTATLRPGDDIEAAARKILREAHGRHGSFYDPIPYRGSVI